MQLHCRTKIFFLLFDMYVLRLGHANFSITRKKSLKFATLAEIRDGIYSTVYTLLYRLLGVSIENFVYRIIYSKAETTL